MRSVAPSLRGALGGAAAGGALTVQVALGSKLVLGPVALVALGVMNVGLGVALGAVAAALVGRLRPPGWSWALMLGGGPLLGLQAAEAVVAHDLLGPVHPGLALAGGALAGAAVGLGLPLLARRWPWGEHAVVALGFLVAVVTAVGQHETGPTPRASGRDRPNVLLVTVSGARSDRYGAYPIDTAAMDRLAAEGAVFSTAVSPTPTGLAGHGALLGHDGAEARTLAEQLAAKGYQTAGFPSHRSLARGSGMDRGFATYDDDFFWVKGFERTPLGALVQRALGWHAPTGRPAGDTVDRAIRYLGSAPGVWFAWVELHDPVAPYAPPPPWDQRYLHGAGVSDPKGAGLEGVDIAPGHGDTLRGVTNPAYVEALYDGAVAYADAEVARLLTALDDQGWAGTTLVIYAGAHGEALGEAGEWYGHGGSLSPAVVDVPLALRLPGRVPVGEVQTGPVAVGDVPATVLDYVLQGEADAAKGVSLRPMLEHQGRARPGVRAELNTSSGRWLGWRTEGAWFVAAPDQPVEAQVTDPDVLVDWTGPAVRTVLERLEQQATPEDVARVLGQLGDGSGR